MLMKIYKEIVNIKEYLIQVVINYNDVIISHVSKYFLKSNKRVRIKTLKAENTYRTNFLSDKVLDLLKQYYQFQIACGFEMKETDYIFRTWDGKSNVDSHKLSEEWCS